jgi:class 3 adenylate cyclase/tetratricopeptide (TPR) repeat protein
MLGPFTMTFRENTAGPWPRPTAKRLCELLLVSPGRRIGREAACEALFPNLSPDAASNALSKALTLARSVLSRLGAPATELLEADRTNIWVSSNCKLDVDFGPHEEALRSALHMEPGARRDEALVRGLSNEGVLLEDEPYADWAIGPREHLETLRQKARTELARDRARGEGRSHPEAVIEAWDECLAHDPTSEEAASALMRLHAARGHGQVALQAYDRCRVALEDLGLRVSPALEELQRSTVAVARSRSRGDLGTAPVPRPAHPRLGKDERRLVSVLFAELSGAVGMGQRLDPEDLREVVSAALAGIIAEVEGLGGTITSVSGGGLAALFGAPEAHEDDPERAVRAGSRILAAIGGRSPMPGTEDLSVRVGIETGTAIVGPIRTGAGVDYAAIGEVVPVAAALQSAARARSVLVGPATRAATEGIFEWGPTEEIASTEAAKPLVASYLERPKARSAGYRGQSKLAGHSRLVGRQDEVAVLDRALRDAVSGTGSTSGTGSVVFIVGDPGLGKTRLMQECRKRFMAWVGAGTSRLPLWLEGRCASYASSTPYGLYQQLLSSWVGVAPEEGEEVVRPALERAMKAVFGGQGDQVAFLAHLMGLPAGPNEGHLARLSPEGLQRATFGAVTAVVARLVATGPTILALEDLHWADPTSLKLTEELSALAGEGPLLVLATRRHDPDPGVAGLEASLRSEGRCALQRIELFPLPEQAERDLARSLIGEDVDARVVEAVCASVEGNPLFLEERFSSLLETGALVRDENAWHLGETIEAEIPDVLERLIRSRVDRLGQDQREAIMAASVLGAEFPLSALSAVTNVNGELQTAVAGLCSARLVSEVRQAPEPVYRFRHALIQEATYRGMLRSERRQLHARAAWNLEAASSDRLDEVAAVLGHHFAMAGETERAVHHLEVAADRAACVFANDEAVALYRRALALIAEQPAAEATVRAGVELRTKLTDVLLHTGRHGEARAALQEALGLVGPLGRFQAARIHGRLGLVEMADHEYEAALAAFDQAEVLLGDQANHDQPASEVWLEIQLDGRAQLHYWRDEPERAAAVLAAARPVVDERGSPLQRQKFYAGLAMQRARQHRYRVDEEILANTRSALAAAREGSPEHEVAFSVFLLGFFLLWHGDLPPAEEQLRASLAMADRIGDVVLRARCLCYLNVTALRRHDVGAVRSLAPEAMAAGQDAGYPEYVACAMATNAWLEWHDQRYEDVVPLASAALDLWGTTVVRYSWYWVCLFPLIAARLAAGEIDEAIAASRQLLVPPQQRLPDELESMLVQVSAAWDSGDRQGAADKLAAALDVARDLRYT